MAQTEEGAALYSIGAAARASGVKPDLIRAWERRYGLVRPIRNETGRRRYTREQVELLALLAEATAAGHAISELGRLEAPALRALVEEEHGARPPLPQKPLAPQQLVAAGVSAALGLDAGRLQELLRQALLENDYPTLVEGILEPLLTRIGEEWESGRLSPAHEHLVSATVRSFLGSWLLGSRPPPTAPVLVLGTPNGERHELGLLLAAVTAATEGWQVTYLGPDLSAADLVTVVRQLGARALALGVAALDLDELAAFVRELVTALPGIELYVGGAVAEAERARLERLGARCPDGLDAFRQALRRGQP